MFDLKMKEVVCNWTIVLYCASYLCYFTGFSEVITYARCFVITICSFWRYRVLCSGANTSCSVQVASDMASYHGSRSLNWRCITVILPHLCIFNTCLRGVEWNISLSISGCLPQFPARHHKWFTIIRDSRLPLMLEREARVAAKLCGLFRRFLYFAISNIYIWTSQPHQMNACNREMQS